MSIPGELRAGFRSADAMRELSAWLERLGFEIMKSSTAGADPESIEASSKDPVIKGVVRIVRHADVRELGMLTFAGAQKLDLAYWFAYSVPLVPTALLLATALEHPLPQHRLDAVKALGLIYLSERDETRWRPDVDATLWKVATTDSEALVSVHAALSMTAMNAARGAELIDHLLATEERDGVREPLDRIKAGFEHVRGARPEPAAQVEEIPLVFPFVAYESAEAIRTRFDVLALGDLERDPKRPERFRFTAGDPNDQTWTLGMWADEKWQIGCVWFTGKKAVIAAHAYGEQVYLAPEELLHPMARESKWPRHRGWALLGLAFTHDPRSRELAERAKNSEDAEEREAGELACDVLASPPPLG